MINDKIRDEKLQYNINREVTKISALSSGKIDKYEYLVLPFDKRRIEKAKFTYCNLGKAFQKHVKIIEDQGIKQVEALKALKPEENEQDEFFWLNDCVFVYELSDCELESRCSHLDDN